MENKEYTYKRIAGTLDYGLRNPPVFIRYMWAFVGLGVFCLVIFTVATIVAREPLLLLAVTLFPLFFCSFGGYFIIRERCHNNVIKLLCQDAVEIVAYTEKVYCESARMRTYNGAAFILLNPKYNQPYILKVKVKYRTEKHIYFSNAKENSPFDSLFLKGCSYHGKMVEDYGDGKVKILYSPKYDKVMFLKDEKVKKIVSEEIEE
ncbi:MAG: hypothetical protein J1F65_01310 [Clostridiales bacterium]|nr:hypothetical protein [Clostridiales bacterium]